MVLLKVSFYLFLTEQQIKELQTKEVIIENHNLFLWERHLRDIRGMVFMKSLNNVNKKR